MTSETTRTPDRIYVWVWLSGETEPVVAGALEQRGERTVFNYGRSYLARSNAVPLYSPELPLEQGYIDPVSGLTVAGCITDASPDAWGQRVVLHKRFGRITREVDHDTLSLFDYLLESGSDRVGALDFQERSDVYVPRHAAGTLDELVNAASRLEDGEPFSPDLDGALLHRSSLGGARPKVTLTDGGRQMIAKFSSKHDTFPVVRAEAVAMDLARRVGLDVAQTRVVESLGHDVLLVERFDRTSARGERKMLVSALTILQLDEMFARYATYFELADIVRKRFTNPKATLEELFGRIVFNVCVSNTDDHARNHAAFWHPEDATNGEMTLTPAYDIAPQNRSGGEAQQAMAIGRDGYRMSQLKGAIAQCDVYLLNEREARQIVARQLDVIRTEWHSAADHAQLTGAERDALWGRQILNPFALEDLRL